MFLECSFAAVSILVDQSVVLVGDTYHNANRWVSVRAPEITLRPVGTRQLAAGGTR
jgi:hypothetical protein